MLKSVFRTTQFKKDFKVLLKNTIVPISLNKPLTHSWLRTSNYSAQNTATIR